jgi:hypothetical protein
LAVIPAPLLVRTSGVIAKAQNICGGTMLKLNPVQAIQGNGKIKISTMAVGRRKATKSH